MLPLPWLHADIHSLCLKWCVVGHSENQYIQRDASRLTNKHKHRVDLSVLVDPHADLSDLALRLPQMLKIRPESKLYCQHHIYAPIN